jgi:hypothetical protein
LRIDKDRPAVGIEPDVPTTRDEPVAQRTWVEPPRRGAKRPYKERSDVLPVIVEAGAELAEAATSNIVVAGARAVGHGALRVGSVGLDALGSVAEVGGEVLSGAADVVGGAAEGCAGCATVIVAIPIGLSLFSYLMFF